MLAAGDKDARYAWAFETAALPHRESIMTHVVEMLMFRHLGNATCFQDSPAVGDLRHAIVSRIWLPVYEWS